MVKENDFPYQDENVYMIFLRLNNNIRVMNKIVIASSIEVIQKNLGNYIENITQILDIISLKDFKNWFNDYTGYDLILLTEGHVGKNWFVRYKLDGEVVNKVIHAETLNDVLEFCRDEFKVLPSMLFEERLLYFLIESLQRISEGYDKNQCLVIGDRYASMTEAYLYKNLDNDKKQAIDDIYDDLFKS